MSQSVLCKQTLQKKIGGIKLLFIKGSKPIPLVLGNSPRKELQNICLTDYLLI